MYAVSGDSLAVLYSGSSHIALNIPTQQILYPIRRTRKKHSASIPHCSRISSSEHSLAKRQHHETKPSLLVVVSLDANGVFKLFVVTQARIVYGFGKYLRTVQNNTNITIKAEPYTTKVSRKTCASLGWTMSPVVFVVVFVVLVVVTFSCSVRTILAYNPSKKKSSLLLLPPPPAAVSIIKDDEEFIISQLAC